MKKHRTFIVNNLDKFQKEFYRMYDPDYWLYKIMLLKNSHDDFTKLKPSLTKNIGEPIDQDFKRVIRTELHFLYFQMVETLFEIIFAITENDNRNLWAALTFSDYRNNYKKISELNDQSFIFTEKVKTEIDNEKVEIPLLRWVFYFIYPTKLNDEEWKKNLDNIKKLLLVFAHDFSDRGEYNAYKHSLRFYNAPFTVTIGLGSKEKMVLSSSKDCITFLEAQKKKNKEGKTIPTKRILKINKSFDFQRDYNLCILIYTMIKMIIETRKYSLIEECIGKKFSLVNFLNIDFSKLNNKNINKMSFSI